MRIVCSAALSLFLFLNGCSHGRALAEFRAPDVPSPGSLLGIERVGGYSHWALRFMFWMNGVSDDLPTEYGIDLYRVTYGTLAPDGRPIPVSGLLAMPRATAPHRGVVSWQHGTASLRADAPSNLNIYQGVLPAAVFAGHGYVLLAPDYVGFGVSAEPHSYYHKESIARSVTDFVVAVRTLFRTEQIDWPGSLFLTGFSQGGHASLAAQQWIESGAEQGLQVSGVAPVAGAVDLAKTGLGNAMRGESKFSSLYIAWIASSYARDYDLSLPSVLQAKWVPAVEELFDGEHDGAAIVSTLPSDPLDLLAPDVVEAHRTGGSHRFLDLLRENELLGWTPKAPVCAYFGELDVDVTPRQAEIMSSLSDAVHSRSVGPFDHDGTILQAAPLLRDWFDRGAPLGGC